MERKLQELLQKYESCLTDKELDFLTDFEYKTSNMYGLHKIHESEEKSIKNNKKYI